MEYFFFKTCIYILWRLNPQFHSFIIRKIELEQRNDDYIENMSYYSYRLLTFNAQDAIVATDEDGKQIREFQVQMFGINKKGGTKRSNVYGNKNLPTNLSRSSDEGVHKILLDTGYLSIS